MKNIGLFPKGPNDQHYYHVLIVRGTKKFLVMVWHRTCVNQYQRWPSSIMPYARWRIGYGFWPQIGCVTIPGREAAFLVARQRFPDTPFTQVLLPLCLPCATTKLARSPLKAEGRPNGCRGRSRVAHRTFRHRHGYHGRREVLSMFKTVAQRSPRGVGRSQVAQRRQDEGTHIAVVAEWMHSGRSLVAQ